MTPVAAAAGHGGFFEDNTHLQVMQGYYLLNVKLVHVGCSTAGHAETFALMSAAAVVTIEA